MGRPWWYEDYWEKDNKQRKGFKLPRRSVWVWAAVVALSLLLTVNNGVFHISLTSWLLGFVSYLCRILSYAIFFRAILSWFTTNRYNLLVVLLDVVVGPILSPLRRIVPRLGMFDITPLVAIVILSIIPIIINAILF